MNPESRTLGEMGSPLAESTSDRTRQERTTTAEVVGGGSFTEAIGGAAAIVLSIIGLAAVYPSFMASISAIVIGAALMLRGCALTARYYSLLEESDASSGGQEAELGGGISTEVMGGIAGIVLGILALVNVAPIILISVSAIVLGVTLLLGCGTNSRLNELVVDRMHQRENGRRIAGDILAAANGAQALVGVAAAVLGIVAVCTQYSLVLSLVAFLAMGSSVLFSGGTVTGRMMTMLMRTSNGHHHHWRHLGHAG